ncbi:uncharacterized protein LOC131163471 [Malania oleifera]|uniref:uncharacterized protein LOC131163471 n=1 Tax=Malania oleifera TaxID=397392 RepID=UPI0025AEA562|nr:uncharacterized protein LOC131163471 [Malania oleifera]
MAPYEALYVCWCRSPLYWDMVSEQQILGPELVQQTFAKVELIRVRIKAAQSQLKSCADTCRRELEFEIGDMILLMIDPMKGVMRVYNVFHVSVLRKYVSDPLHVISYESLEIKDVLAYKEVSVQILDQKIQELCTKEISLMKVLWWNHAAKEASWELKTEIR